MSKTAIVTPQAPAAVGTYSQAIQVGSTVYCSGQIPLDPHSGQLVTDSINAQIDQVLRNLQQICLAAGGNLQHIVKLTVYLIDLSSFAVVNNLMSKYFTTPYPARAAVQVAALPLGAAVEMDAVLVIDQEAI